MLMRLSDSDIYLDIQVSDIIL